MKAWKRGVCPGRRRKATKRTVRRLMERARRDPAFFGQLYLGVTLTSEYGIFMRYIMDDRNFKQYLEAGTVSLGVPRELLG